MKKIKDKVVAITGAGSGIGRSMALEFAAQGAHLALSDVNKAGLTETVSLITDPSLKVTQHIVNVADEQAMEDYAKDVYDQHGRINIIVNNAGVAVANASIQDSELKDIKWMMDINFWGVIHGIRAFLPYISKEPEGHVVIVSSLGGFISGYKMGYYCATKFAVRAIAEALYNELYDTNIGVTGVHPGGTVTNLPSNSRASNMTQKDIDEYSKKVSTLLITSPDVVAKKTVKGIKKNKLRVITGLDANLMYWLNRLMPISLIKILSKGKLIKKF